MDNNRIVRAITSVTCVMLLVKLLGMVRNILQARQFGAGADVDVFTLANNYSVSLFTTICYALCIAAIPIFSQKLLESRQSCYETADTFISNTLILSLLVLGGLLLLGATGAAKLFLGEQAQGELFRFCFLVLLPTLPIIMLTYLLLALFQPMGHFNLQGSLSLLYNAALCVALVAGGEKLSLKTFTVLTSVCWLFQLAMVLPCIKKEQYHFHFRPNLRQRSYWPFLRTGMLTMYNSAVFLLCYLINAHFATAAPTGTVASYFYADRLYEPLATALIYSVSIVLFPSFSQKYTQMEHREYRQYVVYILKNALLFLLPVSLLFAAFGTPVIRVLFEGGDFSAQNALVCGSIFSRYCIGMVGFFVLDILNKAYYAMGRTLIPILTTSGVLGVCGLSNLLVSHFLPERPELLALGSSVGFCLAALVGYVLFARMGQAKLPVKQLLWGTVCSVALGLAAFWLYSWKIVRFSSKLWTVLLCGGVGIVGLLIYILLMGRYIPTCEILQKLWRKER